MDKLLQRAEALQVDPLSIKMATALQTIAIGRARRLGDGSEGCIAEPLMAAGGILFCIAQSGKDEQGAPLNHSDPQLYRTRFEFHGRVISRDDAERLLDGQRIEVAA